MMNPIKKLIQEYKATRRNVQSQIQEASIQIETMKVQMRKLANDLSMAKATENDARIQQIRGEIIDKKRELQNLKEMKKTLSSDVSNLNYAIEWMQTARCPGNKRGIENRAAYDREIPVDPYWLQLNSDEDQTTLLIDDEKGDIDQEQLLKEITRSLNKKEKEILVMSANHMSIRRISNMTRIPRSTVHDILKKCKKKIEDEGWMIV